jgi:predicted peptidase
MRFPLVARLSPLLVLLSAAVASADPAAGKQTAEVYEAGGQKLGYLLYLPSDYGKDAAKQWPVILFLHGSGEAGDGAAQLDKVKKHGPPKLVEQGKDFGFVLISPQNPPSDRSKPGGRRGWDAKQLKGLLDDVLATKAKQADRDRIYLTGLSMGGFGSWAMAATYPDTFAAVAPICGGGDPSTAAAIKHLPIWVFHGEKDTSVKIDRSEAMVDALKAAGAKQVEFTRYPDLAHDSWTVTYDNPKLYEWFLKHRRTGKQK